MHKHDQLPTRCTPGRTSSSGSSSASLSPKLQPTAKRPWRTVLPDDRPEDRFAAEDQRQPLAHLGGANIDAGIRIVAMIKTTTKSCSSGACVGYPSQDHRGAVDRVHHVLAHGVHMIHTDRLRDAARNASRLADRHRAIPRAGFPGRTMRGTASGQRRWLWPAAGSPADTDEIPHHQSSILENQS
jgi:hypothetical protein